MRVLMLAPGAIVHSQRPLRWLLDAGCEVVFMDQTDPAIEADRYRFLPFPRARAMRYWAPIVGHSAAMLGALVMIAPQLRRAWRHLDPDVVHVHWLDRRAYFAARAGIRPLVISVWGTDVNRHFMEGADEVERRVASEALRRADLVIVDEPEMVQRCEALANQSVRTELVHLGVDTELFRPLPTEVTSRWRQDLQISPNAKVVLSIRAWGRNYNHDAITEAFARARSRLPNESVLVLKRYNLMSYGDTDAYEAELRRQIDQLGVGPWIRWIDEIDFERLPELYAMADVVVNFPTIDTFPVTLLEAAACERPVVTALLPSYRRTFVQQHLVCVPPGDIAALAAAIVTALEPSPPGTFAAAREDVVSHYDERVSAERLLRCYELITSVLHSGDRH